MQILKETDQILTEELFEELQLRGWRVTEIHYAVDTDWRTLYLKDDQNQEVLLKVLPGYSLADHKNAIKRALITHDPSIPDKME